MIKYDNSVCVRMNDTQGQIEGLCELRCRKSTTGETRVYVRLKLILRGSYWLD